MSFLFDRAYRLVVGQTGPGGGIEIKDLRIIFDISKTSAKTPNRSKIQIYNLAPGNRTMLEKPNTKCELWAGYLEDTGPQLMFKGDVTFAWTRYEQADVVTELELGDGNTAYRDTVVSLSYGKNIDSNTVLRDLAGKMGLPLNMPNEAPSRRWENGLSFHGPARTALDKVSRGSGLDWSIQNGSLQVLRSGGSTTRQVIVLAADSGMLGTPERQRKGAQEKAKDTGAQTAQRKTVSSPTEKWDGWKVQSLLLPTINPGDRVKMESRTITGVMVVKELQHQGDSHGGDWQTELSITDPVSSTPRAGSTPRSR